MKILVYNKIQKCIEIQTAWRVYVAFSSAKKYGVMFDLNADRRIFIPLESKESANEYIRKLFQTKQLDLTKTPIESNYLYGTMEMDDSSTTLEAAASGENIPKDSNLHYQQLLSDTFYDSIANLFLQILIEENIEYDSELLSKETIKKVFENNSEHPLVKRLLLLKDPVEYTYQAMWRLDISAGKKWIHTL